MGLIKPEKQFDDGGETFSGEWAERDKFGGGGVKTTYHRGMTLWDYFAA